MIKKFHGFLSYRWSKTEVLRFSIRGSGLCGSHRHPFNCNQHVFVYTQTEFCQECQILCPTLDIWGSRIIDFFRSKPKPAKTLTTDICWYYVDKIFGIIKSLGENFMIRGDYMPIDLHWKSSKWIPKMHHFLVGFAMLLRIFNGCWTSWTKVAVSGWTHLRFILER